MSTKKKVVLRKKLAPNVAGLQGGHYEMAEVLATKYVFSLMRTQMPQYDELAFADNLIEYLRELDPQFLFLIMQDEFSAGFFLGQLHAVIGMDHEENGGNYDE